MGIASINKSKNWFLEKTDKVDNSLEKLINIKKVKVQMNTGGTKLPHQWWTLYPEC